MPRARKSRSTFYLLPFLWLVISTHAWGQWERAVPVTTRPPVIDGRISGAEWEGAVTIEDLRQIEPVEGGAPSERTIVYLLVDNRHLYIGLYCFDSDPAGVIGTLRTRDARLDPDDRVEFVIDTFLDRRNAYFFQIGPGGSKGDALIANNGSFFNKSWDGIWRGKATTTDRGWSAELAIPARTLSMGTGLDSWGFNLRRFIKRKNEIVGWANPSRTKRIFNIASAGTITGVSVLDQGLGLDVIPYTAVRSARYHDTGREFTKLEPGVDLRYRITQSLLATLTVNTDFAETEVDDRVINLTRFPVFFPEKRSFFLEDSGIFSFGGLRQELVPFFSRRIGISEDGDVVPILAGVKLSGRVGDLNVGVLDVVTDSLGDLDSRNLAALRVSMNIMEQSQVGAVFTHGDPATNGENVLGGVDFTYRTDEFLDDRTLRFDAFALGTWDDPESSTDSSETGYAYGLKGSYPNDVLEIEVAWREISEDFRPDLGFVRRRGTRTLQGEIKYEPRPASDLIRSFTFEVEPEVYFSLADGRVDTFQVRTVPLEVLFESGDLIGLRFQPHVERLTAPFEISEGIFLPVGNYSYERFVALLEFSDKRPFSGRVRFEGGSFFNGSRTSWEFRLAWRPKPGLSVDVGYEHNDIDVDQGDFETNQLLLRLNVDFTPDLTWSTLVQFDDVSDSIGINSRLRWIIEPGQDVFLVLNRGISTKDGDGHTSFRPVATEVTLKVAYTFRF